MRMATPIRAASADPGPRVGYPLSTIFSWARFEKGLSVRERPLAEAAIVVEEFDKRDIAIDPAEIDLPSGIKQQVGIAFDGSGFVGIGRLRIRCLPAGRLAFLHHLDDGLLERFGVFGEIVFDHVADFLGVLRQILDDRFDLTPAPTALRTAISSRMPRLQGSSPVSQYALTTSSD